MAITEVRIHPAIGIARIGNSDSEFFVGPELRAQCHRDARGSPGRSRHPRHGPVPDDVRRLVAELRRTVGDAG
jgi:hypothetical protein